MNEIFLDTETTGLSIKDDHRIVEIACIETQNLMPTKKVFYKLINPERPVSEDAFKVHGYSNEILKKEPTFKEIANEFIEFIAGKKLIIHNAPFDIGFINHELKKVNLKLIDKEKNIIDTLEVARLKYPGSSNSLDNLCKKFSIDLSKRTKHNALLDCELLRKVYINLVGEKEPSLIFQKNNETEVSDLRKKNIINYSKKVVNISDTDFENHKSFLKRDFKKSYF